MPAPSPSPDLFYQPLAETIDLRHPLAVLAIHGEKRRVLHLNRATCWVQSGYPG